MGIRDFFWIVFFLITIPVIMSYYLYILAKNDNYDFFEDGHDLKRRITGDEAYEY